MLELQGDVDIRAVGGMLNLVSDKAVAIQAPEVGLSARKLTTIADTVVQKLGTLRQRVNEL